MKTPIKSNRRLPAHALYAFLIAIVVLWAMPRKAWAQVYVTQLPSIISPYGIVSEYDAVTGGLINANLITALNNPAGLALTEDNKTLFVSNYGSDFVGKFDANTGAAINRAFITGVNNPIGLAVVQGLLYVVRTNGRKGAIGEYYVETGAPITRDFATGLDGPQGLATDYFDGAVFVALELSDSVVRYHRTGYIDYSISGLPHPIGVARGSFWLYVTNGDGVSKFDARTGRTIDRNFITGLSIPLGVAVNQQNIFVLYFDPVALDGRVAKYDELSGKLIKKDFITGLRVPLAIAVKR